MLQVQLLHDERERALKGLKKKGFREIEAVERALELDRERRSIQQQLDAQKAEANQISKEIGVLYKQQKKEEAESLKKKTTELKEKSEQLAEALNRVVDDLFKELVKLPNIPHESVPEGSKPEDNELVRKGGEAPQLHPHVKPHWELANELNIIDFELGNKITGSGFPVYKGKGAKLQRALISFFLDNAIEAGYTEVIPPHMVNAATAFGTGQLPDKEAQMYELKLDPYYLIPTAEVPVTNILRDEIVKEEDFPVRFTAYTPCFRREAGSYGKDVRGLNRVHQFDKVEIVEIEHPERSYETLERMVSYVEGLLQKLELPYRVLKLCAGDMSFASALTYDMEVFSAAQEKWLEVSSISNFETFQSNRLKIRFKDKETGKMRLAHTLNGSALALPRIVAALLENNQTESGIIIPEALRRYTGFDKI